MLHDSRKNPTRPDDFDFMPADEWAEFDDQLRSGLQQSGLDVEVLDQGELVLTDGRRLPVLSLAQLCHLNSVEHWEKLIERHLEHLAAHVGGIPEPFSMLDLRVELLPDDMADRDVLRLLGVRPFAEGVVATLSVRLSDHVRPVAATEIDELGWDVEESWESAWAQTRTMERPQRANFVEADGAQLIHLHSDHPFGATFLPFLDDVIDEIGEHGALVSIPVRDSILFHSIQDLSVLAAAHAMIPITRQVNHCSAGSVSAHLYWWRDGTVSWIPTYFADDGMEFYPPADLAALIERLD